MRRVLEVAVREFRTTVLTKAFLIAAVILPSVMWGMAILLPAVLHAPPKALVGTLAVLDPTGLVAPLLAREFDAQAYLARQAQQRAELEAALAQTLPAQFRDSLREQLTRLLEAPAPAVELEVGGSDLDALKARLRTGELLGVAVIGEEVLSLERAENKAELFLRESVTREHLDALQGGLQRAVVAARAQREGLDLERARAVLDRPAIVTTTVTRKGGEARENELTKLFVPLAFMLLVWMSTWVTGNYLLTSTIEEKSNRVIEVLLSAVSPLELLSGKILGQCAVGLVMVGLYGGVGVSAAFNFGYAHLVPPEKLAYLGLYFVMAYLMVAATMAAVGSAVSELREAQTLLGPVTLIFMVPLLAWFFISEHPNSPFAVAISFIPPMTPFAMILRVTSAESVPTWQVAATTVVGFAGVWGMIWAAARIFRVGILMTGKPATPGELLKWIRFE